MYQVTFKLVIALRKSRSSHDSRARSIQPTVETFLANTEKNSKVEIERNHYSIHMLAVLYDLNA